MVSSLSNEDVAQLQLQEDLVQCWQLTSLGCTQDKFCTAQKTPDLVSNQTKGTAQDKTPTVILTHHLSKSVIL